jgi:hypothetical protein
MLKIIIKFTKIIDGGGGAFQNSILPSQEAAVGG